MTKKIKTILVLVLLTSQVSSFSLEDINKELGDDFGINLETDKVNVHLKSQEKIIIDGNGKSEGGTVKEIYDGGKNLDLGNIGKAEVEDNTQQGESEDTYQGVNIPANYEAINEEIIERNLSLKVYRFEMDEYEYISNKVKKSLSRYYNKDITNILEGGVPSSFGFGAGGVGNTDAVDETGLEIGGSSGSASDCSITCDCGRWYSSFGQCKQVPRNAYSTGRGYKCLRGYRKSAGKCILIQTDYGINETPYDNIRYKGIDTEEGDDPYNIKVKGSSSSSSLNLNIPPTPYSYNNSFVFPSVGSPCGKYASCINNSSHLFYVPAK